MFAIQVSGFLNYCKEQLSLSNHTIVAYQQDLKAFIKFTELHSVKAFPTEEQIVFYHQYLRKTAKASPATIRRRFVTLKFYFRWLEEQEDTQSSPFQNLRLDLKVPKRLPRPVERPTLSEVLKSTNFKTFGSIVNIETSDLQVAINRTTGLIIRLLIVTGLRVGEITNLRIKDVSGFCSRIRVLGKGSRERTVYVANECLLKDFRDYWENRREKDSSDAFLFLNRRGTRLTEVALRKRLKTLSKELLIEPHLTPHQFRHSAATLLIEEGVDIRIVQRLLGHASIATTEIYTKVSDVALVSAITNANTLANLDS